MTTTAADCDLYLQRFGLRAFRPGQREVVQAILQGDHCLCIMPTGGGKSLCYQMPSVMRDGLTLVVSPLIALMKDQVDALQRLGISATCINSTIAPADVQQRLRHLQEGRYDLVYIAPERFRSPSFGDALAGTRVQLLAVDEAHCISEWGHDFRIDYSRLGQFRRQLGFPQTIALTATATEDVRLDIVRQLGLDKVRTFVAGFARHNLHYECQAVHGRRDKQEALLDFLREVEGVGIVYTSTRKQCEETAELLHHELGESIVAYHGGMMPEDRRVVQERFMNDEARVVVATNAFGMGIDKPDVRFVIHFNMPGTLEAYYQEAGRAGRDGLPARCLLLFTGSDRYIQEFFIDNSYPSPEVIREVYDFLRQCPDDPIELTQDELRRTLRLSIGAEGVGTCERLLEKAGALQRLEPQRNMGAVRLDSDLPTLVDLLPPQAKAQRKVLRAIERTVGQRRFDWVYLRPQQLVESTELDGAAVSRALRELQRLDTFDYIPPFRGRAVHMRHRDVPFEQLDLKLAELEERRAFALTKLERIEDFCRSRRRCRQRMVLEYFGDPEAADCGHCDNCDGGQLASSRKAKGAQRVDRGEANRLAPSADSAVPPCAPLDAAATSIAGPHSAAQSSIADVDANRETRTGEDATSVAVTELLQKVLSGVVRCRRKGPFGKHVVVGMLCGSRSAKLARWKLDQLSTFGLLRGWRRADVSDVIDRLLAEGLVQAVDAERFRPTLEITPLGEDMLRGRVLPGTRLVSALTPYLRLDASHAPARREPPSPPVPRCTEPQASQPTAAERLAADDPQSGPAPSPLRPDWYWTWKLLADGYAADDCQAVRRFDRAVMLDHLLSAAAAGHGIEPSWIWTAEQCRHLAAWLADDRAAAGLGPAIPASCSHQDVRLFQQCSGQPLGAG
jgi:ATP-dependent DNA helicase RecQ